MALSGDDSFAGPGPDAVFRAALEQGVFQVQCCDACCRHVFYPRALCPFCGSASLSWVRPSGIGRVYATTTIRQRPERGPHYNVCLVDLEEGPRMVSTVIDVGGDAVQIGMEVQVKIVRGGEGEAMVVFSPLVAENRHA